MVFASGIDENAALIRSQIHPEANWAGLRLGEDVDQRGWQELSRDDIKVAA